MKKVCWSNPTQILPLRLRPLFYFFAGFQFGMLGGSISINKFVVIVWEKIGKTL